MKYMDMVKKTLPGLRLGWQNPKNPHSCPNGKKCTAASNTDNTTTGTGTTSETTTASTSTASSTGRPFKAVLE